MQTLRTVVLRCVVLGMVLSLPLVFPRTARAEILKGLSLRVGGYLTTETGARHITGAGAPSIGLQYELPWVPKLLDGETWSTSLSVDLAYRDWTLTNGGKADEHAFRYVATSLNQVYHFEEQDRVTPYMGFCITAATFGNTGGPVTARQGTVTRIGGGLIVGADLTGTHMYLEGRYEKFFRGCTRYVPDGFRGVLGYRF